MKKVFVAGGGGFIGHHLVKRLKEEGCRVRAADLKYPEFEKSPADEFILADLRREAQCRDALDCPYDEVYQLAADMGGAGYVFSGENDAEIMRNSLAINLNMLSACRDSGARRIFFSSSACVYPEYNQSDPENPQCSEDSAYPAQPDSDYGWEKLTSERLYLAHARNCGLEVRIARYHNIFGPLGAWYGGREKAPAAICRKVADAPPDGSVDIWGDGMQTRSFLYIDECVEGTLRLMRSSFTGPLNIGSAEMVTINQLAAVVMDVAGKKLGLRHIPGPQGVRGRTSENTLTMRMLGWQPSLPLSEGLRLTYAWIESEARKTSPGDRKSDSRPAERLSDR